MSGKNETAGDVEAPKRRQALDDLRRVLETDYGRRYVWHLLEEASVFESIWDSSSKIHYNSGKQDFGHMIFAEIAKAKPDALFEMMNASQRMSLQLESKETK